MAVAADLLAERRPGGQAPDPGGAAAEADADRAQPALAVPAGRCSSSSNPLINASLPASATAGLPRRLPATQKMLQGLGGYPARTRTACSTASGPFLEQLNPILSWIGGHQQLTSDFITDGGVGFFARTTRSAAAAPATTCGSSGRAARRRCRSIANRDANNRGNTYPSPLWLSQIFNPAALPATGASRPGTAGTPAATIARLPRTADRRASSSLLDAARAAGAPQQYKVPAINAASYSSKLGRGGRPAGGRGRGRGHGRAALRPGGARYAATGGSLVWYARGWRSVVALPVRAPRLEQLLGERRLP